VTFTDTELIMHSPPNTLKLVTSYVVMRRSYALNVNALIDFYFTTFLLCCFIMTDSMKECRE